MIQELLDGTDFYTTIVEMGEEVVFQTEPQVKQFASITPYRRTNSTDGAYWYYGAMTFDSVEQQNALKGEYFSRQTNAGPKYILHSVMPENSTPKVATVYAAECNETIDLISHYEKTGKIDKFGEEELVPVFIAKNVPAYATSALEPLKQEQPGSLVKTKITFVIPARFMLSEQNIILRTGVVFDKKAKKNVIGKIRYRIESVDPSMIDFQNGKITGVSRILTTEDRR